MWNKPENKPEPMTLVFVAYNGGSTPKTCLGMFIPPRCVPTGVFQHTPKKNVYLIEVYDGVEYLISGWYNINIYNNRVEFISEPIDHWSYIPNHGNNDIDDLCDKCLDSLPSPKDAQTNGCD